MSKRNIVRIISYCLCIVAILSSITIISSNKTKNYQRKLEATYQHSLMELSECIDSIETSLNKSSYANDEKMIFDIAKDLYAQCVCAKNALADLPINQMNLSSANKFLTQTADYAYYISNEIRNKKQLDKEEYQNLCLLLDYSKEYSNHIDEMVNKCVLGAKITENEIKNKDTNKKMSNFSINFDEAEKSFKSYPTLLYDGPFADAVLNRESQMIKNAKGKSKEECKEIAANILKTDTSKIAFIDEDYGKIPTFNFKYNNQYIAITKNGGYISYIIDSKKVDKKTITTENAINIAKDFLNKIGYKNMQSTYYTINNNVCVINFAYTQNNIINYSDLIKVGISLGDGSIYSMEATGYLTNHKIREIPKEFITENEAKKHLVNNVDILGTKLSLIPLENGLEKYCYEFHCKNKTNNEEVLIYINALTAEEENILILLYSDNGTLTK